LSVVAQKRGAALTRLPLTSEEYVGCISDRVVADNE
jgi:hypothetical protein